MEVKSKEYWKARRLDVEAEARRKLKSARIIVRNISFKSTEDSLKKYFSQFGEVKEVCLLKKPDGKLVGCCFIQYEKKIDAAVAIAKASGKPFLGRPVVADWALPKNKFQSSRGPSLKNDPASNESEDIHIKEEPSDSDENFEDDSDGESDDEKSKVQVKPEKSEDDDEKPKIEPDDSEDIDSKPNLSGSKPKRFSHDVSEGKTVFLKNVPFSTTEEELKEVLSKYGRLYYVKICIDKLSEHSKGTAFVKYLRKGSADKIIAAGTELQVNGSVMEAVPALSREDIAKKLDKPKLPSDSRNLYLLKEGVIVAGSKASEGISENDMAKRLQLEKWKRQIIKDLGKFVSRTRLVVHNIPISCDDKRLAALIKKFSSPTSKITELKIMRNMKKYDVKGQPVSKGFAFVSFSKHEDALAALRSLNNNPSVFKAHRRPIVSFSVESRKALSLKEKRLLHSRKLVKTSKNLEVKVEKNEKTKKVKIKTEDGESKKIKKPKSVKVNKISDTVDFQESNPQEFAGMIATPGTKKFMHNLDIKHQALIHKATLKKAKAKMKQKRKAAERLENIKQKKMKRQDREPKDDQEFSNLVAKYRNQFKSIKSKKWFETD